MSQTSVPWTGYFIMFLGVVVLGTGLYLLTAQMMGRRTLIGTLMLVYGVVMLILGSGMLANIFSMMQGSTVSGTAMLFLGAAMLYSGYSMANK